MFIRLREELQLDDAKISIWPNRAMGHHQAFVEVSKPVKQDKMSRAFPWGELLMPSQCLDGISWSFSVCLDYVPGDFYTSIAPQEGKLWVVERALSGPALWHPESHSVTVLSQVAENLCIRYPTASVGGQGAHVGAQRCRANFEREVSRCVQVPFSG